MPETVQDRPTSADPLDGTEERLRLDLIVDLDAGFGELVRTHERVVYSVALRLVSSPVDAEDVAAETFLRAYRALLGYDAERLRVLRIRPWLLTILRNAARNAVRDAGRRPGPPPECAPVEPVDAHPSVEQQVEQDLERREWARLLGRLPEVQRTAVVLRHVEGVPTGEIAEILGCPEGTVKSHVSRGLRRLRALLAEAETGGEVR
jgi:RNA polymerase sigma-70 factor (ECF subfamily)